MNLGNCNIYWPTVNTAAQLYYTLKCSSEKKRKPQFYQLWIWNLGILKLSIVSKFHGLDTDV